MKKSRKVILSLLFFYVMNTSQSLSQTKVCEIKFGEKKGIEALERKRNMQIQNNSYLGQSEFYCYQIGLEHDGNQNPIDSNPIYACCRSS